MLFLWVFPKLFYVVIVGSPLASNDHCYVLLIVPYHFKLRTLYVHTLFSITLNQKSLIKSIFVGKNSLDKPGWSGPTPDHLTFSAKTLLIKPGWSDPTSDHPILEISGWSGPTPDHPALAPKTLWSCPDDPTLPWIIRPWQLDYIYSRRRDALTLSFFFHRRHPFSPQKLHAVISFLTGISLSSLAHLILHISEDPDPSGTPSIHAGISKVFHSKSSCPDLSM